MNAFEELYSYITSEPSAGGPLSLNDLQKWADELGVSVHLAIMTEPYLSKVCTGEKYIESRLTKVNIAPFERASADDIVLFKRSGGAITAMALVEDTHFEYLSPREGPKSLAERYADGLGYEPGYLETKMQARFASLLWLREVRTVPKIALAKRGRQAWITVRPFAMHQSAPTSVGSPEMLF